MCAQMTPPWMRDLPTYGGKVASTLEPPSSSSVPSRRRRSATSYEGTSRLRQSAAICAHTICSLQDALYEPALEYYTNHSKRVRRKRNRHSQAASYQLPLSPMASAGIARPLRPEGGTVRYEYKMACFAEFRGEDQVALK